MDFANYILGTERRNHPPPPMPPQQQQQQQRRQQQQQEETNNSNTYSNRRGKISWSSVYIMLTFLLSVPYFYFVATELLEKLAAVGSSSVDASGMVNSPLGPQPYETVGVEVGTGGGDEKYSNFDHNTFVGNGNLFPSLAIQKVEIALQLFRDHRMGALIFLHDYVCLLFFLGKTLSRLALQRLRTIESHHLQERMFNYFLWRFATLPALLEPKMHEFLIWMLWFTTLGFLRMMSLLCRDRLEYLCNSPHVSKEQIRVISLLVGILLVDISLSIFSIYVFRMAGVLLVLLLNVETMVLFLESVQTLTKYGIHLVELSKEGVWEERVYLVYYTELITESLKDVVWLMHYLLIPQIYVISSPIIILFFMLYMRAYGTDLWKKYKQFVEFRRANQNLNNCYQDATPDDLLNFNDFCAICRDTMSAAKKLPCGHLFHAACLRSWLAQHVSCPTCRASLSGNSGGQASGSGGTNNNNSNNNNNNGEINGTQTAPNVIPPRVPNVSTNGVEFMPLWPQAQTQFPPEPPLHLFQQQDDDDDVSSSSASSVLHNQSQSLHPHPHLLHHHHRHHHIHHHQPFSASSTTTTTNAATATSAPSSSPTPTSTTATTGTTNSDREAPTSSRRSILSGLTLPTITRRRRQIDPQALATMTSQVSEVFPNLSTATIQADLLRTNSVNITITNILEGRV